MHTFSKYMRYMMYQIQILKCIKLSYSKQTFTKQLSVSVVCLDCMKAEKNPRNLVPSQLGALQKDFAGLQKTQKPGNPVPTLAEGFLNLTERLAPCIRILGSCIRNFGSCRKISGFCRIISGSCIKIWRKSVLVPMQFWVFQSLVAWMLSKVLLMVEWSVCVLFC